MTNTLKPGLKDYTGPNSGLFFLVHHDILYEWSYDIKERMQYIEAEKPDEEIETRLNSLTYIPTERLPQDLRVMVQQTETALSVFNAAREAWYGLSFGEDGFQIKKLEYWDARHQLDQAVSRLNVAPFSGDSADMLVLLKEMVPDNTWNGKEIIFSVR